MTSHEYPEPADSSPAGPYAIARLQRRDFANQLDATGLILREIGFPTKRHRDFVDAVQAVAGGRTGPFKCPHIVMARRCQHGGGEAAASAFVRRELDLIERFIRRTGYQIFKIVRGGGIEHEATSYEDFLTPAANLATRLARASEMWKEHPGRALEAQIPEAVKLIPHVPATEAEAGEPLPLDEQILIKRNLTRALNLIRSSAGLAAKNGGDARGFIEHASRQVLGLAEKVEFEEYLSHEQREGAAAGREAEDGARPIGGGVTDLSPVYLRGAGRRVVPPALAAALEYADKGLPVFPVSVDKSPLTRRGFKDATLDGPVIRHWWSKYPGANVGVPTGYLSGWLALDVDPRNGGDASLAELIEKYGPLPQTLEQETGGGGFHLIFAFPELAGIGNARGRLPEGIDVRGEGGYVVVPPSVHASNRPYRWRNDLEPAAAPGWLVALLKDKSPRLPSRMGTGQEGVSITMDRQGERVREGGRNEFLFRRYASPLAGKGASLPEIVRVAAEANDQFCEPPLGMSEVEKLCRSAFSKEAEKRSAGLRRVGEAGAA